MKLMKSSSDQQFLFVVLYANFYPTGNSTEISGNKKISLFFVQLYQKPLGVSNHRSLGVTIILLFSQLCPTLRCPSFNSC